MPVTLTQPSEQRDFIDWRRGRAYFSVWAIDLCLPEIELAAQALREACAGVWLPEYVRQPHLTLHVCGFPSSVARLGDDFAEVALCAQLAALREAKLGPFGIRIGHPDSFRSAAYLSVDDPDGVIERLRALFGVEIACHAADRFRPHVTIGLYGGAFPLGDVVARLQAAWRRQPIEVTVTKLCWMRYQAPVIGGALQTVGEFDLLSGLWREAAPGLLGATFDGE